MIPRKLLSADEVQKYFDLRDLLAIYANEYFELGLELYDRINAYRIDEDYLEVLERVWADTQVIDELLIDDCGTLSQNDSDILRSWKWHLNSMFTVFEHEGHIYFMAEGYLFDVCGLSQPIADMLGHEFPQMVTTTLLPFGERIVYDGNLVTVPVHIGPNMREIIDDEIAKALDSAERVRDGKRLMEVAPLIAEAIVKREADRIAEDFELDMKAQEQLPGHHAGALVGLSEDERDAAINERISQLENIGDFDPVSLLRDECSRGVPVRKLRDCMTLSPKETFRRMAKVYGIKYFDKKRKAEVVNEVHEAFLADDFLLTGALLNQTPAQLENTKKVWAAGGMISVKKEGLSSLAGLPPTALLLMYCFETEDEFVFIMPDEIRDALTEETWKFARAEVLEQQRVRDTTEVLMALRGVASYLELYMEYNRCYPNGFDFSEFVRVLQDSITSEYLGYDILLADDNSFWVLDVDLAWAWKQDHDVPEDDDFFLHVGDFGPTIEMILDARDGKEPRPLPEGVRSYGEYRDWVEEMPAMRTLRNYLDAHVPDAADDYFFADKAMEELLEYMKAGFTGPSNVTNYLDIISELGFAPNEAHLHKLLDMLMNMANAMPVWMNYGWAPNELHEAETGQKQFYNEDGSPMKVGRNDPCPCGSGKKYKKCCGKRK